MNPLTNWSQQHHTLLSAGSGRFPSTEAIGEDGARDESCRQVISGDFCFNVIYQSQDNSWNCGNSTLVNFNNYRCYGILAVGVNPWTNRSQQQHKLLRAGSGCFSSTEARREDGGRDESCCPVTSWTGSSARSEHCDVSRPLPARSSGTVSYVHQCSFFQN